MGQMYVGHFDGGATPNPGERTIGGVIHSPEGEIVVQYSEHIGHGTNNEAEYESLIRLLKMAIQYEIKSLAVRGDSALVINQVTGKWKVRDPKMKELCTIARDLIPQIDTVEFKHVKRELNREADALT